MKIGEKIKSLRIMRNMTQEELAVKSDLTRGFISQVERDLTSPTLENLEMILRALGTDLKDFFSNLENKEKVVFTKEDRIPIYDTPEGVYEELLLTASEPKNIEPSLIILDPCKATKVEKSHEGIEFGYVIEGEIELYLNKEVYIVDSEECFFYSSNRKHFIKNKSKTKKAKVIWIEIY
ncbi:helix-turn-helix domain-containing protein [Petrotoga sp. 9PWA.NaAc.5.4]|uniref:helix-turn-helix domain-containing protein n=1 Tax=Petrotoga sp. 9PWA.NaAc.5.4 TaxID=1434328 RepID=UPI000CAB55E2|nr:helix-turn-helix domain-containing protein [Petrotoga sp. 9PWA.NaAc.5.4]PNR97076.1 XRE family transcriptional regulator [Petrotoga sp. 9PWA.NaAc.5.4]